MKSKNLLIHLATGASILTTAFAAHAHPLTITNNTLTPLSFTVNKVCSQEINTINEKESKTLSEEQLYRMCENFKSPCEIKAYNKPNCQGQTIGGMLYFTELNFAVFGEPESNVSISATDSNLIYTSANNKN